MVGKAIEHTPATGILRHDRIIFQLVEIQSGFLTMKKIHEKAHPEDVNLSLSGISSHKDSANQRQPLGRADGSIIPLDDMPHLSQLG